MSKRIVIIMYLRSEWNKGRKNEHKKVNILIWIIIIQLIIQLATFLIKLFHICSTNPITYLFGCQCKSTIIQKVLPLRCQTIEIQSSTLLMVEDGEWNIKGVLNYGIFFSPFLHFIILSGNYTFHVSHVCKWEKLFS